MGATYEKFGLTDQLQSRDSLATKSTFTNSVEFESNFEGAAAQQILSGRVRGKIIINDGTTDRVIIGKLD